MSLGTRLLISVGLLLVQAAWIIYIMTVPPRS